MKAKVLELVGGGSVINRHTPSSLFIIIFYDKPLPNFNYFCMKIKAVYN